MGDAYPGIITPYNTKEFEAMIADIRSHFNANATALQVVGVSLRRELPRARNLSGRSHMMGADLRLAAWQIARQFAQASASQTATAAAVTRALTIYHGNFHSNGRHAGGRRFDAA